MDSAARAGSELAGNVASEAGMTVKSSVTCRPGTFGPKRAPRRPPPPRALKSVFCTMTRTTLLGSALAAYCRSGWIFFVESRLTTGGGAVLASAIGAKRLDPSRRDARSGAMNF